MSNKILLFLLCAVFLAGCGTGSPSNPRMERVRVESWPGESWQLSTPEAHGLDVQAITKLDQELQAGKHGYVDSMLIIRSGEIVFEAYYENDYKKINADDVADGGELGPYNYLDANWHPYYQGSDLHTLQSTTKSVISALVGIAIERGDLPGVEATLGDLLPHRNIKDPQKAAITLENILTMTPGFQWEEDIPYSDPRNDGSALELTSDWVGYLLNKRLVAKQGTTFKYNSAATQLMSEMLTTATGLSAQEYAEKYLFGPIGIEDYYWKVAPEGFQDGLGGLYLSTRDLARFALLYERGGEWNGVQVVPAAWVERSGKPLVGIVAPENPEYKVSYGYQWWVFAYADNEPHMYGGWGWGGQFPLVVPELDLVAVFTGWNIYDEDFEYTYELFYDRIVKTALP